jgi:hypothetical protein
MNEIWLSSEVAAGYRGKPLQRTSNTYTFGKGRTKEVVANKYHIEGDDDKTVWLSDDMLEEWPQPNPFAIGDKIARSVYVDSEEYVIVVGTLPRTNNYDTVVVHREGRYAPWCIDSGEFHKWEEPKKTVDFKPGHSYIRLLGGSKSTRYIDVISVKDGWAFGIGFHSPGGAAVGVAIPTTNNPNWKEVE